MVSVPPVQSTALLSAKASVAPLLRFKEAVLVMSSRPVVSAKVPVASVALPMKTSEASGSTPVAPRVSVPAVSVVGPM